jgi:hypothetical protein
MMCCTIIKTDAVMVEFFEFYASHTRVAGTEISNLWLAHDRHISLHTPTTAGHKLVRV